MADWFGSACGGGWLIALAFFNQTNHNGGLILVHFGSLSLRFGGRRGEQRAERGFSDTTTPRFRCGHRPAVQTGGADC